MSVIREDCVEVNPILLDLRKKGSAKAAQKFTQIPIGMIASVEVHHAERSNCVFFLPETKPVDTLSYFGGKKLCMPPHMVITEAHNIYFGDFICFKGTMHYVTIVVCIRAKRIVRITYLRVPAAMQRTFLQAIMQCDSTTMESALPHSPLSSSVDTCLIAAPGTGDVGRVHWHLGHIYEASSWKSFQMEANSDDAWRIGVRINDIMDGRQSQSRSKIRKSEHGDRFSPSKRLLEPQPMARLFPPGQLVRCRVRLAPVKS
ncbi:hypothetical protein DdX_17011 [Ditylenchus destructor]|uniref:Uncharacterized protein n=1 Tax=Ditylenchus destructor TaxID=166010 RepID=A0AAD4QZD1_9BILA|nr:hypothetical protein DdX_17011 [Ditylenchus destructor]